MATSPLVLFSKASVLAIIIPLSFCILAASSLPDVQINFSTIQPVYGNRLKITCIVSGIRDPEYFRLKVKFQCPFVDRNRACFQDCKATCTPQTGCTASQTKLLSAFSCESFQETDKIRFEYQFPFTKDAFAGDYACQFFGVMSAIVNLPKPKRPITLPPKPPTKKPAPKPRPTKPPAPPTLRTTKKAIVVPVIPKKEKTVTPGYIPLPCQNMPTPEPVVDVHRERIMVIIMVLLICSLAINIVIIVRCVVKSHYIKYPHKKRMNTLLCLNLDHHGSAHPTQIQYAPSVGLSAIDDAAGSDSTYSMPTSAFMPMSGHGRANTLPVIPGSDSQGIVFIPVIANSLGTLQSASHPRLNSPLPDNVSIGIPAGGASGRKPSEPPAIPARDNPHRLSTSSIHLRPKVPPHPANGCVKEEYYDPEEETLID